MSSVKHGPCPLCYRQTALTFHHLIPRKVHRRTHFKKHYSKQQLGEGILICRTCHSGIHKRYNEMQLAKELNTLGDLRNDPELCRFYDWVSKQKIQV